MGPRGYSVRLLGAVARMWRLRTDRTGRIRRQRLRNDRHHLTPGIESA
ncbi:hypothetical protein [Rhodococcus erythropolis]|nr:hypothetical protein [Rhodococcus erythropolis]MBT2267719.1 hypothetical protein [Rhodococcus erythropolis]